MRSRLFALVLLPCACHTASDWKPSQPGDIFRYTSVGSSSPLDSIVLGQPWISAPKYGAGARDTLNSLPAGVFGGADAIRVRRNATGIVTALEFDYSADRDVRAVLSEYEADLGAPAEVSVDSVSGEQRRTTVWRNADTEFRIIQFTPPRPNNVAAMAILSDK
jgi:hypothetical protein